MKPILGPKQSSLKSLVLGLPMLAGLMSLWLTSSTDLKTQAGFLIIVVLVAIVSLAELLIRNLPRPLLEIADSNAFRLSGRVSERRAYEERRALGKLRRDFWAVGLTLSGFWLSLVYLFHAFYTPLPLVARGVLAIDRHPAHWVDSMKEAGVKREVESSLERVYGGGRREAAERSEFFWKIAPIVGIGILFAFLLSSYGVHLGYRMALGDYKDGLLRRQAQYTQRDIVRLQEYELEEEVRTAVSSEANS